MADTTRAEGTSGAARSQPALPRPWQPVILARLGGFGDALIGGSGGMNPDTGAGMMMT